MRLNKKRAVLTGLCILSFLAFVYMLPQMFSSTWGNDLLASYINKKIEGHIEFNSMRFSWSSGQHIEGLKIIDKSNRTLLSVDSIETKTGIISLAFGNLSGKTVINNLSLSLVPYEDGTTNIERLLRKTVGKETAKPLPAIELTHVYAEGDSTPALQLKVSGKTFQKSRSGTFNLSVESVNPTGDLLVKADINQFPVAFLDELAALKNPSLRGTLTALLGDTLNIKIDQVLEKKKNPGGFGLDKLILSLVSDKARVSIEAHPNQGKELVALEVEMGGIHSTPLFFEFSERVSLVKPVTIHLDITPQAVHKYVESPVALKWEAPSPAKVELSELSGGYSNQEWLSTTLQAALEIQNLVLFNLPGLGDIEIEKAALRTNAEKLNDVHFHLDMDIKAIDPEGLVKQVATDPFHATIEGRLILNEEGFAGIDDVSVHLKNGAIDLSLEGKVSPHHDLVMTAPAMLVWRSNQDSLTLSIDPIDISLKAPRIHQLKGSLKSSVHPDELIALEWDHETKTLIASGALNEFPVGYLSEEAAALFGPSISGSLLVNIRNGENGPVHFSLKGANGHLALDGRYESGHLYLNKDFEGEFKATPELAKTLLKKVMPVLDGLISSNAPLRLQIGAQNFSLPMFPFELENVHIHQATAHFGHMQFQNKGHLAKILSILKPGSGSELSLWFTPLYLHMKDGILSLSRTDILVQGAYPIAAWGNIDLIKSTVDMQIGLSGYAIAHAFNVMIGNPNLYVPVPLRGSLSDPTFDKAAATSQIAALVAASQGPPGMILGAVLQIASGSSGSSPADVPPPTTNPLPWEGKIQLEEPSVTGNPVTIPIKAVSEGAGKLLKNIFR